MKFETPEALELPEKGFVADPDAYAAPEGGNVEVKVNP